MAGRETGACLAWRSTDDVVDEPGSALLAEDEAALCGAGGGRDCRADGRAVAVGVLLLAVYRELLYGRLDAEQLVAVAPSLGLECGCQVSRDVALRQHGAEELLDCAARLRRGDGCRGRWPGRAGDCRTGCSGRRGTGGGGAAGSRARARGA